MPLFQPTKDTDQRHNATVDFLLDHCFGFTYYHPDTGELQRSSREIGIPQGPSLSAWIGNILLFKLDSALRKKLKELNSNGLIRAGYARYVDDVVILGDSLDIIDVLRALIEDIANSLGLEMISKESFAPMTSDEFERHLTSGRAIAASGPREEQALFEAGDGDAGWDMWHTDEVNRQTSLELLRDNRLYSLPPEIIENQIFTALRAKDLRPSELSKAARWVWYEAIINTSDHSPKNIFKEYWSIWNKVCAGAPFILNSDLPWDDPAFYAIEGLEGLLERANSGSLRLNPEEEQLRSARISILANAACFDDFIYFFIQPGHSDAPAGWAYGTAKLRRMVYQRLICMQWKAALLSNHDIKTKNKPALIIKMIVDEDQPLQASLKRALTTHVETWKLQFTDLASIKYDVYSEKSSIVGAFAWLHKAIVQLSSSSSLDGTDPLEYLRPELDEINKKSITQDKLIPILNALLIKTEQQEDNTPGEIIILSLQTIATISPREKLPNLLASRLHLLQNGEQKLPLPPLPGIPANGLLLCSHATSGEWTKLSKIWWVTLSNDTFAECPPEFKISYPDKPALLYFPEWVSTEFGNLAIHEAEWTAEANWALKAPATFKVNSGNLRWVADTFEAIARLNHDNTNENSNSSKEFAAAWPYLAVNSRPDTNDQIPLELSLLTPSYSTKLLDGAAYIKDGTRGLRTYDVPELYGHHWRTGVLLSELFGYRRDLDQFASLGEEHIECDTNEVISPADHLLRNVLRKLRGNYARGMVLKSYETAEHLPATISRSLNLLRNFPSDGEVSHGIAFVLASESETAAMQIRLGHDLQVNQAGINYSFFERIALRVVNQIPLNWTEELNKNTLPLTMNTKRSIPSFYSELSCRIQNLLVCNPQNQANNLSFKILVTGLKIASITTWLREIAFCIEALDHKDAWSFPTSGDLAGDWQIEEQGFFFSSPENSINDLSEFFTKTVKESSPLQVFSDITPLGWLTIVSGRIGLFGKHAKKPLLKIISTAAQEQAKALASLFATSSALELEPSGLVNSEWPFETNHEEIADYWMGISLMEQTSFLAEIELCLGLKVKNSVGAWRLDTGNGSFTDTTGESWKLTRSQLSIGHGNKPERIEVGTKLLSAWDETSDQKDNLLFVAARGERFKKLVEITPKLENTENLAPPPFINSEPKDLVQPPFPSPMLQHTASDAITNNAKPSVALPDSQPTIDTSERTSHQLHPDLNSDSSFNSSQSWRDLQREAWSLRKGRSPGHTRIAIMQWKVDETYHHPATELEHWDKKWPPETPLLPMEKSRAESRRRKFISEALNSCEAFGVDILVLPEYSVRPDTVKWLREQLKRKPNYPAVLAGTYKLHGNSTDANFEKTYNSILGNSDHLKTFGQSIANGSSEHSNSYLSGEHSAIVTLLAPLELTTGERIVCTFSRRKKYSSLAASEVFSPLIENLRPLFSAENLIEEIGARSITDQRVTPGIPLTPKTFLHYYNELGKLDNIAEFICSELFLPMSPVNYKALAAELNKLAIRFGASMSPLKAEKSLLDDLESMAEYLGISVASGKRKSIILVPAMTTRSADYWIFGQSTLLSGGATTVFCNAVAEKSSIGGSCFIGRNSWVRDKKSATIDKITPYAGWSKGIYYNQPTDALGESEQAIVIADIDPSFMQEGRPRPQALAIPLQLVAYLPIVETKASDALIFRNRLDQVLSRIIKKPLLGRISDPNDPEFEELNLILSEQLNKSDNGSFLDRFNHWVKYWCANPFAGPPPAIVDWIGIGPTSESDAPDIFIPKQS
ncbi:RNA-directed DNA polymerase [Pseudomonas viridiflava]|uniref:RNA-directed DNA polymerase n=1 Tax=Pseudomonas viridiflava TaxID=33069 RepID=UPI0013D87520|nr:RNA-directed DNA polymerase [Pseudomonas viridiflava]